MTKEQQGEKMTLNIVFIKGYYKEMPCHILLQKCQEKYGVEFRLTKFKTVVCIIVDLYP